MEDDMTTPTTSMGEATQATPGTDATAQGTDPAWQQIISSGARPQDVKNLLDISAQLNNKDAAPTMLQQLATSLGAHHGFDPASIFGGGQAAAAPDDSPIALPEDWQNMTNQQMSDMLNQAANKGAQLAISKMGMGGSHGQQLHEMMQSHAQTKAQQQAAKIGQDVSKALGKSFETDFGVKLDPQLVADAALKYPGLVGNPEQLAMVAMHGQIKSSLNARDARPTGPNKVLSPTGKSGSPAGGLNDADFAALAATDPRG